MKRRKKRKKKLKWKKKMRMLFATAMLQWTCVTRRAASKNSETDSAVR